MKTAIFKKKIKILKNLHKKFVNFGVIEEINRLLKQH